MSLDNKISWCPVYNIDAKLENTHYNSLLDNQHTVEPELRSHDNQSKIPDSPPNGGLYGGPQSNKPWANKPVVPSMTNLIHNNLRSANPPPGATEQYVGTDRFGNNLAPMPNIYWFNPCNKHGLYNIKGPKI